MSPLNCPLSPSIPEKKKKEQSLSNQQSVSAKSSTLLLLPHHVFLCPGMALHGEIHFGRPWTRRGCFGWESRALCASQPFSLVKLNSFLFSPGPSPTLLVFCGLILPGSWAISPELLFQAFFSSSDNFTLLRLVFSRILTNRHDSTRKLRWIKVYRGSSNVYGGPRTHRLAYLEGRAGWSEWII